MLNFAIFKATNKKSDKSPDYTSTIKVESEVVLRPGVEYSLAGWIKESRNGSKYQSIVIKEKDSNAYKKIESAFESGFSAAPNEDDPF